MSKKKTFNEGDTVYYYILYDGSGGHVERGTVNYPRGSGLYVIRTGRNTERILSEKELYATSEAAESALGKARRKQRLYDLELRWDCLFDSFQTLFKTMEVLRKDTMDTIRDLKGGGK